MPTTALDRGCTVLVPAETSGPQRTEDLIAMLESKKVFPSHNSTINFEATGEYITRLALESIFYDPGEIMRRKSA
eukprot:294927-Amorphochlora_amoeboformis.AAC.2